MARVASMKASAELPDGGVPLPPGLSGMFCQYQSPAVLCTSACQLERVVDLPPPRRSG